MASKGEAELSKLFSQLQLAGEDGDYEWGLEVAEQILQIVPDDPDALLCRLVSFIQLSEFEDGLKEINRLSKAAGNEVYLYEKAYCQYKLERYQHSLKTLSNLPPEEQSSIRVLDLTAQIYYRLENYVKSAETFQKGRTCEDSQERSANMAAALSYCNSDTVTTLLSSLPVPEDTMEQCFNMATSILNVYSDKDHLNEAELLLQKSEKLCEEMIADDEDNEQELIPIQIQLAYCLQCKGQHEQALAMYASVLKQRPSSLVHTIVAANNVIVLNGDKDIFDSKKKIKLVSNEQGIKKLNSKQQAVVHFNRCLFALQINQLEQCRQLLQEFKTSKKTEEVILIEAALLNREKKLSECCACIEQYIKNKPCSILVYLTLAQCYLSQGNQAKVCEVLENVPEVTRYLGIVSVLVSLYAAVGTDDKIKVLLDNVIAYWKHKGKVTSSVERVFWTIGQYKLHHGFPEEAASIFEYLYNQDKSNIRYLANLISAYSRYNTQKAEELGRQLSQSYAALSTIDVDSLEQMPSFRHTRRQVAKNEVTKNNQMNPTETGKEKKKKRKPKLPKNYDPTKPPDPERWLPLRERSYYRKSKKKGQQTGVGRGTQGLTAASASLAAKLDASKPKSDGVKSKVQDATSSPKPKSTPAVNQHKKKKKGKR